MATKKRYTEEEIKKAYEALQEFKGQQLLAIVNSVSRSGMSRRIEFYGIGSYFPRGEKREKQIIKRIGYYIARVAKYPYDVDKGGILVNGCGMDMRYSIISNFNYAAMRLDGVKWEDWNKEHEGRQAYDQYFFDATCST